MSVLLSAGQLRRPQSWRPVAAFASTFCILVAALPAGCTCHLPLCCWVCSVMWWPAACSSLPCSVHIPWREAPLTRWLQRALGGAAYVLLLATVAPGPDAAADTLSVLNWASKFRSDGAARRASGLWTSPEGDLEAPVALRGPAVEPVKRRWVQLWTGWGSGAVDKL